MAGKIKALVDEFIRLRTDGNEAFVGLVRAHLIVKGIHPDDYTDTSEDDQVVIARLVQMIDDFKRTSLNN